LAVQPSIALSGRPQRSTATLFIAKIPHHPFCNLSLQTVSNWAGISGSPFLSTSGKPVMIARRKSIEAQGRSAYKGSFSARSVTFSERPAGLR
jgi:hypothetical protein